MTIPGQDRKVPYSNAVFDRLSADQSDPGNRDSGQRQPIRGRMPNLEELLKSQTPAIETRLFFASRYEVCSRN